MSASINNSYRLSPLKRVTEAALIGEGIEECGGEASGHQQGPGHVSHH